MSQRKKPNTNVLVYLSGTTDCKNTRKPDGCVGGCSEALWQSCHVIVNSDTALYIIFGGPSGCLSIAARGPGHWLRQCYGRNANARHPKTCSRGWVVNAAYHQARRAPSPPLSDRRTAHPLHPPAAPESVRPCPHRSAAPGAVQTRCRSACARQSVAPSPRPSFCFSFWVTAG